MIVATAGHVDHGKTTLVRALTGVDTDRLPEEKRRGMTIDLGFAYLMVPGADPLGFVDVPGHERFVHNMLSGLSAIDFGLLVVAADDGPMPQTREHLAILSLLGIDCRAVALTKTDKVDALRIQQLSAELHTKANAPVFPVSAATGRGIEELKAYLLKAARERPKRSVRGSFRMPVDRAFTIDGSGLVITGTIVSGSLEAGAQVRLLPSNLVARVRSIHAWNEPAQRCVAGQRCGINLSGPGLRREAAARGAWAVAVEVTELVAKFDAQLTIVASEARPFENWTPVHVHMGALDVNGRIATLEGPSIIPGHTALVQITLEKPTCARYGDRFIVRDQSASRTVGGGSVLDIFPPARNRGSIDRVRALRASATDDDSLVLSRLLPPATDGLRLDRFAINRNLTEAEAAQLLEADGVVTATPYAFSRQRWQEIRHRFLQALSANPGSTEREVFVAAALRLAPEPQTQVVSELLRERLIVRDMLGLRLPAQQPAMSKEDEAAWKQVADVLQRCAYHPPNIGELAGMIRQDPKKLESLLTRAARLGMAVRLANNRYCLPATIDKVAAIVTELAAAVPDRTVTAAALRDRIGGGRRVAIEFLEHFDRVRLTRRAGDAHVVNGPICYSADR